MNRIGSRRSVWGKKAKMTSGGLTRDKLAVSEKTGKIVSKKKQQQNRKKSNLGTFLVKKKTKTKRKTSRDQ